MSIAAAAVLLLFPPEDTPVEKVLPGAEEIKKLEGTLSDDAVETLEEALGRKIAAAERSPEVYQCLAVVPSISSAEKTLCRVVVIDVKGPKGKIKLGVAVARLRNTVANVAVLENGDDAALASPHFLGQFRGLVFGRSIDDAPADLAETLKSAEAPADDEAKEMAMLLRMSRLMRAVGPRWSALKEKLESKDASAAADLDAMSRAMAESATLGPAATFLEEPDQARFKGHGEQAAKDLAALKDLISGGTFDEAVAQAAKIGSGRCGACHGSYRSAFLSARRSHRIDNGFFSTKVDVSVPDPKLESAYQTVATGVRRAILIAMEF